MKLDGGMLTYVSFPVPEGEERYKNAPSPKGRLVKFMDKGGYDTDRALAKEWFSKYEVLKVKEIYVGNQSSKVEFFGIPEKFNTVMFEDVVSE